MQCQKNTPSPCFSHSGLFVLGVDLLGLEQSLISVLTKWFKWQGFTAALTFHESWWNWAKWSPFGNKWILSLPLGATCGFSTDQLLMVWIQQAGAETATLFVFVFLVALSDWVRLSVSSCVTEALKLWRTLWRLLSENMKCINLSVLLQLIFHDNHSPCVM